MLRPYLLTRKRCYNHPHRETELTCERCKTSLCQECLVKSAAGDARFCAACQRELEEAEAAKLTWRDRLALSLQSFARGMIVAGVLLGLAVGFFLVFRGFFDRPITPEEMARFRYALAGTFETEEGVNVSSTVLGGRLVAASSEAAGYPAKQLINEYTGAGATPWRSLDATFPQEVVVEFQDVSIVQKVVLTASPDEPPATAVREFELLLSTTGPDGDFQVVGRYVLAPAVEPQRFEFAPTPGRWAKLRVLSNYGSSEYTSLDEWNTYVVPRDSRFGSRTPTAAPGTAVPGR